MTRFLPFRLWLAKIPLWAVSLGWAIGIILLLYAMVLVLAAIKNEDTALFVYLRGWV